MLECILHVCIVLSYKEVDLDSYKKRFDELDG